MKKFLTLFVAALMLVSALSMNVFAENDVGTPPHVVGNYETVGGSGGVETFNPTDATGNVSLKVPTVNHRYAVDVVFPTMTLTASDALTWDVNAKKYTGTATPETTTFDVTVKNHSDMGIDIAGKIERNATYSSPTDYPFAEKCTPAAPSIAALKPGDTAKEAQVNVKFEATEENWNTIFNNLLKNNTPSTLQSGIVIATVTVTVSPTA